MPLVTGNDSNNIITPSSASAGVAGWYGGLWGDDTIDGGAGADDMNGGDGNDTYHVDNVDDIVREDWDDVSGGTADTVLATVTYSIGPGTFRNQGHGIENLTLMGSANINATGNSKNNILNGNSGNNVLNGGAGNDKLFGGAGDDFIDGGFGFDTIDGGLGNDTTSYAFYSGPINANLATGLVSFPGNSVFTDRLISIENLIGTAGNDTIIGNTADNSLFGEAGNDTINGGDGNDKLFGGAGNDWIDGGFGFDTIDGGLGNDTTSYAFYGGPINANLSTGVVSFPGDSVLTDTLVSIENLIGTAGNDTIIGNTANNSLNGGAGNDSINGGDGVDTLIGGDGNDTLTGGAGADKFRFNSLSEKVDTIQDFFRTQGDKIEVSKSGFGATSLSQISYNAGTGSLSFLGTEFAKIANLPAGFAVSLDVVLI